MTDLPKGWPIYSDERARRTDYALSIGIFGILLPSLAATVMSYVGVGPAWKIWLQMFAMFGILCGFLSFMIAFVSGRLKYTPSAVMWVPVLGKPRWVWLGDVRRLHQNSQGYQFDLGRIVNVPLVGSQQSRRSAGTRAKRERIDRWMDSRFSTIPQPKQISRTAKVVSAMIQLVLTPLVAWLLVPPLIEAWTSTRFSPAFQSSAALRSVMAGLTCFVVIGVVMVIPFVAYMVAGWFLGTKPQLRVGTQWRLRRDVHQGFEVQTPSGVSSAADSPIMPAP